jgi:hypothetical protein
MWWLFSVALACETGIPRSDLHTLAASFENAFARRDLGDLRRTHATLTATLPCVVERLTPRDAAWLHRLDGMMAFVDDRPADANAAFQAARAADPTYVLSVGLVPTGHPMRTLYADATPLQTVVDVPRPDEGALLLDGQPSTDRPTGRPVVFQRTDATGTVVATRYLASTASWPSYPVGSSRSGVGWDVELGGVVLGPTRAYGAGRMTAGAGVHLPLAAAWRIRIAAWMALGAELSDERLGVALLPALEIGPRWGSGALWAEPHVQLQLNDDVRRVSAGLGVRAGVCRPLAEHLSWTASLGGGAVSGHLDGGLAPYGLLRVGLERR